MTQDSEKDTDKYYTTFDGEDAENTWWEYMVKTKAIAEKYKWMSAIESNMDNPTTKEQRAGEATGKHWFVMTCKGEALQYIRIHHDKGSVQDLWNKLKQPYDGVEYNDLQDLYAKMVSKIEDGPKDSDPLLWFSEIERANEESGKGGGKLKDNDEIMVLIRKPMRESKHYADCATALKVSATTKKMESKE
jgi:hypothetical protein